MKLLRVLLGLLPFVGILVGVFFVNRVTPFIFGLPFLLFWMVAWAVVTALLMLVVYQLDAHAQRGHTRPNNGNSN